MDLLAEHFSNADANSTGPSSAQIREALGRIDLGKVVYNRDRIVLPRGMALTLNGIAQGYVTDRAVDILRRGGIVSSLVNMGEIRSLGPRPNRQPWRIGIQGSQLAAERLPSFDLVDRAAATSSGSGFAFDPAGLQPPS